MRRIVFAAVAIGGGFIAAAAINADPPAQASRQSVSHTQVDATTRKPPAAAPTPVVQASPADVFMKDAREITRLHGAAFIAARTCKLRSEAWIYSLDIGLVLYLQNAAYQAIPNPKQASAALEALAADFTRSRDYYATRCGELMNSEIMDRLDAMQSRLTGGYH